MADSPLSKADISNLHKTVVKLQDARRQIDLAKQAGVDVEEHDQRNQHAMGLAQSLLKSYGTSPIKAIE